MLVFTVPSFATASSIRIRNLIPSDDKLRLCPRAATVRAFRMTRELDDFRILELEHLFELHPQTEQDFFALLRGASLATGHVSVAAIRHALANGFGPETHAVEAFAHVDDHAHDFAVIVAVLEGFADGGEHHVEPKFVDGCATLV